MADIPPPPQWTGDVSQDMAIMQQYLSDLYVALVLANGPPASSTHTHSGVTTGTDRSGPPVAGT